MRPQIALSSWVCKYASDLVLSARDSHFSAIEWDLNFISIPLYTARRRELFRQFKEAGVDTRFHLPHTTCDLGHPDHVVRQRSLEYLRLNADLIAENGQNYVVLHFDSNDAGTNRATDELCRFVEYCVQRQLIVALENLPWGVTADPANLLHLVSQAGCEIALDTGHAMLRRSPSAFVDFVKMISPRVVHIHLYGKEDEYRNHVPFPSVEAAHFVLQHLRTCVSASWWTCEMDMLSLCRSQRDLVQQWLVSTGSSLDE